MFYFERQTGESEMLGQVGSNTTEILGIPAEMGLT